ncbi:MAG: DsrE family protein [Ferruginibacter sp.]
MGKKTFMALCTLCFITMNMGAQAQTAQATPEKKFQTQTAVALPVKDFGKVYNVPFATDKPDPNLQYKIIFEAGGEAMDSSVLYPPLEHLARMYNLHVYGGVPQKNLHVVLMIAGVGILVAMNNEAYRKRYGIDNPNIRILSQLKAAGIKINGCAQAMTKNKIEPADMNPDVNMVFSRFTTVSTYQMKGYAYFKF